MEFGYLGPLEVLDDRRERIELPGGRARALLALLVLQPGDVVATERAIDDLWGERPPATAATVLQGFVSSLRRLLEPGVAARDATILRTASPGYVLDVGPEQIDALRFRRAVADAGSKSVAERAAVLRDALASWRGPALADFTYEPFAQREIASLEEHRLAALEERFEAELALGMHGEVLGELRAMVDEHPFRERPRAHLMLALYRAGRQTDALEVYRAARETMIEELGIEPGPALRELHEAVLRQDPSLAEPRAPDVAAGPWLRHERRTVTVVYVDLAAARTPGADPEARRAVAGRARETATATLRRHGATVRPLIGEVIVGLFGVPATHEDDAVRALRGAGELLDVDDTARIGIETGEVVIEPDGAAIGDAVTIADELRRVARPGEALIGSGAKEAAADAATVEAAGDGWRLGTVSPASTRIVRRPDAPMLGRASELETVRGALEQARLEWAPTRLTILGDAGIGKSRLAAEFAATADARVLSGHCPPYGDGITFHPMKQIVLQAATDREAIETLLEGRADAAATAADIAGAVGLSADPVRPERLFPALRTFVDALSSSAPLVLLFEDVHWAEPTLLDLIDHFASAAEGPVLLLCLARPELLEERPPLRRSPTLWLEPLERETVEQLIADRLAGEAVRSERIAQVIETAQGNPLFVEQLVAALREGTDDTLPPTVQALLAARIDRLDPAERDLLRCASAAGPWFSEPMLAALVPQRARPRIPGYLATLEAKRLIRQTRTGTFEFGHVLIQQAAHRSMSRRDRARLHLHVADHLAGLDDQPGEADALIGHHLEEVVKERRALGAADDTALRARAGGHLLAAGRRAFGRFDAPATENLMARAAALLPDDDPGHGDALRTLAEVYPVLGRNEDAVALLERLHDGGEEAAAVIEIERARVQLFLCQDDEPLASITERAHVALSLFEQRGDDARAAVACYVIGLAAMIAGTPDEVTAIARRGLAYAERSGHAREQLAARWNIAWALRTGGAHVDEAIPHVEELTRWRGGMHPGVMCELAELLAMKGSFDEARATIERARRHITERMRVRRPLQFAAWASAAVEHLAGDDDDAEAEWRLALAMATEQGERDHIAHLAAELSLALAAHGRAREAAELAAIAEQHAPAGSVAQALWRIAAARAGHPDAAALAREAVERAPAGMPMLRARVLAHAAAIIGGDALLDEARDLARAKGDVATLARVPRSALA